MALALTCTAAEQLETADNPVDERARSGDETGLGGRVPADRGAARSLSELDCACV